jgi:predicted hydrolase (HD superfamily)
MTGFKTQTQQKGVCGLEVTGEPAVHPETAPVVARCAQTSAVESTPPAQRTVPAVEGVAQAQAVVAPTVAAVEKQVEKQEKRRIALRGFKKKEGR